MTHMIHPVILSGGSGTRLWPLSRAALPKQLLALVGEHTMLQETVLRALRLPDMAPPTIVCNHEHRFLIAEQLRDIQVTPASILLEPVGRNTAAAIAVAALDIARHSPDAMMLVLPADHVILDDAAFAHAVERASHTAKRGFLTTFGIHAHSPETGYGYIQQGEPIDGCQYTFTVKAFVEKPDQATARHYIDSGQYSWNSGMFLFSVDALLAELRTLCPDILTACKAALDHAEQDMDFIRLDTQEFTSCPSESIDYAVMEHTQKAAIVPASIGWSDIGAWDALWQIADKDANGNAVRGDVIANDTTNSLIRAESRLVVALGLHDHIIVETPDAVLVAHQSHAQQVKQVVEQLKTRQRTEHISHNRVYRPWGWYEGIDNGERFQVKRIMVKPGAKLSLQMHHHRAEHWIVVSGTAIVQRDTDEILLTENQSTYIPLGCKHRLINPGKLPLHLIEVQSGSYLGEDDIVRYEDIYKRS